MNQEQVLRVIPDIEYDELVMILNITREMSVPQQEQFLMLYQRRRKSRQELLLLSLLGFVGVAGIHRLIIGDIALGIIYLLTGGLCLIGTIVDIININSLTTRYNMKQGYETATLVTAAFNQPRNF
ncbi:TM2 domain-containing protein [Niabella drilacis]|uniref:TM2 domain-containing protein n=1 Tax=Niabella drilacis (strain DSM 25811 / CCM 8410 / CCUG 62505 / LMG 26954 / E90) TaxID=1285928 RepID=A0A1G6NXT4_NIADE|nr:TM2 domain-containing protein [Niabella drilacis]SDC72154.1 TM2 domain-containing protein [Niabella drilacis]